MNSVVGFTIYSQISEHSARALNTAHQNALRYFPHLQKRSLVMGETQLDIWGHQGMDECIHTLPDGSLTVVIGSPHGDVKLCDLEDNLLSGDFIIPWDGRVIVIRISPDGKNWKMWNDWLGSIPVFYAQVGQGRIASTLEPVIVAAAGYTSDDFFMPGLVSLLINGHFVSDWTLYKDMKVIPPDSAVVWDENSFCAKQLWTVEPSQDRWEASWDDLVDEMYELSHQAIADVLKTRQKWILPLSSGLDSRLIAGVAADIGTDAHTYAWGADKTTDVVYSRQIAKTLGFPWKHIELPKDFMVTYTPHWANMFGSAMHFHGMYQMAFLDEISAEPSGPIISGYIGDVLAGSDVVTLSKVHASKNSRQIYDDWHAHWLVDDVKTYVRQPVTAAMQELAQAIENQINAFSGSRYQNLLFLELWSRQRFFTSFQSTLTDYWRGVANPFMTRKYARFCMSLPRTALDYRRLMGEVFRRYYGKLAVIPGTYANEPFILTGRYLLFRRLTDYLPPVFHRGPFKGFRNVQLRMDVESLQASGEEALWPLFETRERLSEWLDFKLLEKDIETLMQSQEDIRPLRRLQSAQTLANRLL